MKHLLAICAIIVLASCGKTGIKDSVTPDPTPVITSTAVLKVSVNKNQIAADGSDEAIVTVTDQNNADVTTSSTIYVNNNALAKNIFSTTTPGSYQIKAVKGDASSTIINVIASSSNSSVFTQKVLAEFYTGTWCGICPGTLIPFESYLNINPNIVLVGVHGPQGSSDPYVFTYDAQMRSAFGVSSVPTVVLNRNGYWDKNTSSLDQLSQQTALLGIGLETSLNGSVVSVKAKVKFGTTITVPLKVVVMLVEDNLVHDQTNYNYFNLPNPIVGYKHRNVLRSSATDVFGDAIPAAQQTTGNIWEKDFNIDASAYNVSNTRIVAFVLYDNNTQNVKGVLNTQIVNVGQTVNF